jgi:methyl-accepting chemotaxis protein
MEEVNSMVQETYKLSKQSSHKAALCVENAFEGVQKMNGLVDSVKTVGKVTNEAFLKVKESNDSLLEVLNLFKEVETKTKVINDIAFQTKLLSFNASVEAARAGEHGKGFAVVAEEIGNLANVVNRSSSEINSLIDSTSSKISHLVQESKTTVEESISKTEFEIKNSQKDAQDGLEFFKGLSATISDINNEIIQVSTASDEQSRGIDQINKAMLQIADANTKNVSMSAELEQQTKVLEEAVTGLKSSNDNLNKILSGS